MIKFTRIKESSIRRVWICTDTGEKVAVDGIIGEVSELLSQGIIYENNTEGNMDKWLYISDHGSSIKEFYSLEDAKEYAKGVLAHG